MPDLVREFIDLIYRHHPTADPRVIDRLGYELRALPPERRTGLIATLHLIVDRFREQTGDDDLEPVLDG